MKTHFDIYEIIKSGKIDNELDFERALITDRKLKLFMKEDSSFIILRKKLRDIIEEYESREYLDSNISQEQIEKSDNAEFIAEKERVFIDQRKTLIKSKLKAFNLTQQQLGLILGHKSKTYISELVNGVSPFSLKDLIIINRVLKIEISNLIPTYLSESDQIKIKSALKELNNPKIRLSKEDLEFVL